MPKIIENVREQLLAVAKKQIEERGYANTTIRSVAGECGLAVGTVYNYFKSKDMLIAGFVVEDWQNILSEIKEIKTFDAREMLRTIYDALNLFAARHKTLFTDPDAAKVFSSVFSERHKTLRSQITEIILPLCTSDDRDFAAEFAAESLLTWTVAGSDFDRICPILLKIIK